jgi:hypothetical protein
MGGTLADGQVLETKNLTAVQPGFIGIASGCHV